MTEHDDATRAVPLGDFASETEASLIAAGLRDHGIEAVVVGGATAGFRAEAPGAARVLVHADALAEARRVAAEIRREATEIDWSKVDLGEFEG